MRYEYMMALYSTVNNLANFVPSLFNPAPAVTVNSSGQVVPGSGNIYNGLIRVSNGIAPSQAYLVPNATNAAVLAVPSGAPRGMYPNAMRGSRASASPTGSIKRPTFAAGSAFSTTACRAIPPCTR